MGDHVFRLRAKNGFGYGWYLSMKKHTFSFLSVQDDSVDIGTAKSGAAPSRPGGQDPFLLLASWLVVCTS